MHIFRLQIQDLKEVFTKWERVSCVLENIPGKRQAFSRHMTGVLTKGIGSFISGSGSQLGPLSGISWRAFKNTNAWIQPYRSAWTALECYLSIFWKSPSDAESQPKLGTTALGLGMWITQVGKLVEDLGMLISEDREVYPEEWGQSIPKEGEEVFLKIVDLYATEWRRMSLSCGGYEQPVQRVEGDSPGTGFPGAS